MAEFLKKFVRFDMKGLTESGEFSGIASAYGNVDLGGDIVQRGAFTKTLKERGAERPILWQHRADSPVGLGTFVDSEDGLLLSKGQLEMDLPDAKKAYSLMKSNIVRGLSIGYEAVSWEWKKAEDIDAWPIRVIKEAKLWEVSIVTFPMNESAVVTAVKSIDEPLIKFFADEIKAGRSISAPNMERLRKAHTEITALLAKAAAAPQPVEPVKDHSAEIKLIESMRATFRG